MVKRNDKSAGRCPLATCSYLTGISYKQSQEDTAKTKTSAHQIVTEVHEF